MSSQNPQELERADEETGNSSAAAEVESKPRRAEEPPPCPDQPLALRIEALLLASDRPMPEARIADLLGIADQRSSTAVRQAIETLNGVYKQTGRSFRIDKLAGGWQILTLPTFGPVLSRLNRDRQQSRLTQAALETLAIIAYRQPVLRAEIEAIRGVACGEVLRGLLERRLVKVAGRAEELGRPMLYGTTREFLTVFGLSGLTDLPPVEGLTGTARKPASGPAPAPAPGYEAAPAYEADPGTDLPDET